MKWPWSKRPPPIRCPHCHADDPGIVIRTLSCEYVRGDGSIDIVVEGAQKFCVRCEWTYCVGPSGCYAIKPPRGVPQGERLPPARKTEHDQEVELAEFGVPTRAPRV